MSMYKYEHLEGWEKYKFLWKKGAVAALLLAFTCAASVFAAYFGASIVQAVIDLFGYKIDDEITFEIPFAIIIIIYAPWCTGVAIDILGDYPPKETKIEE